jgi:two-component system KDP operon response regulator KdpE
MTRPLVLLVEDDVRMRGVLTLALRSNGFDVSAAGTGKEALSQVKRRTPDAMILDLGLPDMDGFEVASSVRQQYELPIIVLSARGGEQDQIRALDGGANDYVVKPIREAELMARIRAALRRPVSFLERREFTLGDLHIDSLQRRVFVGETEVALTPTEFDLLQTLARHADQVVTHRQLLREVWGPNFVEEIQYLRVYMKQLREKIEQNPSRPRRIVTALGVGYRLVSSSSIAD